MNPGRMRAYRSWCAMIRRCEDPQQKAYARYGGRGITICERWRSSFDAFFADMGERADGMTLDRIDVDGDYTPENCRWATNAEQQQNRSVAVLLTVDGITLTLNAWARVAGIAPRTLAARLRSGMTHDTAVRAPLRARNDRSASHSHCPRGHMLEADNYNAKGRRKWCRECKRIATADRRRRNREAA